MLAQGAKVVVYYTYTSLVLFHCKCAMCLIHTHLVHKTGFEVISFLVFKRSKKIIKNHIRILSALLIS